TLSVADARNKVHRCQRRMKQWKPHFNWHKQYRSYYQWWLSQQRNEQTDEDDASTQDGVRAEVQGAVTRDTQRRSTKKDGRHQTKQTKQHDKRSDRRNR